MPQRRYLKVQCKTDTLVDNKKVQRHAPYLDVMANTIIRTIILLTLTGFVISCNNSLHVVAKKLSDDIIIEGKGIGDFELGTTRIEEVYKKLGDNFTLIKHKEYSYQVQYEHLGTSFYYHEGDETKEVFAIEFKHPFEGQTKKGVVLNTTTLQEAANIYGEPDWTSCDNCDVWTVEYKGIEFEVERDKSLPHYPLNEEVHLKKKISAVVVILPSEQ